MSGITRIFFLIGCVSAVFLSDGISQPVDSGIINGIKPRNIGPAGMSGRVTCIEVDHSDPNNILIGSAAGGVWKSGNGGYNWNQIFTSKTTASVGDIAISRANPRIIYVGTGEGNPRNSQNSGDGIYRSSDGGTTWKHTGLEKSKQIHRVIVHPSDPDVVWAGVQGSAWGPHPERGVYKSVDGGKTWNRTLYVNDSTGVADLRVDPSNPDKLIASMWEFRRWPWFFKSGGRGSGIFLSEDGGETWSRIECNSGLPCGELGRIGIAFAPSNPSTVYAFVESTENAIYRSADGGYTWEKRSSKADDKIGNRPFYYADIYVDVKNENRVYSLATDISVSEDGGATWETFVPGDKVHTDHHAWWGHHDDPDFLINGNDGGLFITRDRGVNWFFVENLPLAQFYHIRLDNEIPFNVYGGLQDNGSWRGPSQTWFKGELRNMYWQRIGTGDGFDVIPDPQDNDFGYSMAQSGNLFRYHLPSGLLQKIQPVDRTGEYLRFNWNAGIGINTIDNNTIYFGSQYVHKSTDKGRSWEVISPDLTTNDSSRQMFLESGGLTYDVTGAEFHTTIVSIAPSPLNPNVIWVGTDDGNVQLTRDGGGTWTLLNGIAAGNAATADTVGYSGFSGVPQGAWVPHIHPSTYDAGEAFAVFDNHRRNDREPYAYHTTDYGVTWTRIIDIKDVEGYVNVVIQDSQEPELWFCGTDAGLWYSIDAGRNWNRWSSGLPTMPCSDLAIHPRDGDLVIGTFGRSVWILDDIRPLREMARDSQFFSRSLWLCQPPGAYLAASGESFGYRNGKVGDFLFEGENRPYGALLTIFVDSVAGVPDTLDLMVTNSEGIVVRNLTHVVRQSGLHRLSWDLSRNAPRKPDVAKPDNIEYYKGERVPPGQYVITVRRGDDKVQKTLFVLPDPRLIRSAKEFATKDTLIAEHYRLVSLMTNIADEMRDLDNTLEWLEKRARAQEQPLNDPRYTVFMKEFGELKSRLLGKDVQGIYRQPDVIVRILDKTGSMLNILDPVSENLRIQLEHEKNACARFSARWDEFRNERLRALKTLIAEKGITIF